MSKIKRIVIHLVILLSITYSANAFEWREQMSGVALTSGATYPIIAYGIAEDNWWAIYLGSALGPIPGYIYADKKKWIFPFLRSSAIVGLGFYAAMINSLGSGPGNALIGNEESDRRLEREFNNILKWGFYISAAATVIDVGYIAMASRKLSPNWPKKVDIGFIPFENELRITARF